MGEHIVNGEFQSDKYPWCPPGFVPLKLTDPMAWAPLWDYAYARQSVDKEFADDLWQAVATAKTNAERRDDGDQDNRANAQLRKREWADDKGPGVPFFPSRE